MTREELKAEALINLGSEPAEGAEEILKKHMNGRAVQEYKEELFIEYNTVVAAMQEFATLHAQRLAEKMVEDRLIEFGNMIRDEPNGDIPALAEYFIRTINLKSR